MMDPQAKPNGPIQETALRSAINNSEFHLIKSSTPSTQSLLSQLDSDAREVALEHFQVCSDEGKHLCLQWPTNNTLEAKPEWNMDNKPRRKNKHKR